MMRVKRSQLGRFGLACLCLVIAAVSLACSEVLGFDPGKPFPPGSEPRDASSDRADGGGSHVDASVDASSAADRTTDGVTHVAPDGSDGGVCNAGQLRCTSSGLPQRCNDQGTAFEDQAPCPTNKPDCDNATGLCQARCEAGTRCRVEDVSW